MGLYYKFSPLLIQYIPRETVSAWIQQGSKLDPKCLIPALVQYDHKRIADEVSLIFVFGDFCSTLNP